MSERRYLKARNFSQMQVKAKVLRKIYSNKQRFCQNLDSMHVNLGIWY
jgi:hypothetical protein